MAVQTAIDEGVITPRKVYLPVRSLLHAAQDDIDDLMARMYVLEQENRKLRNQIAQQAMIVLDMENRRVSG